MGRLSRAVRSIEDGSGEPSYASGAVGRVGGEVHRDPAATALPTKKEAGGRRVRNANGPGISYSYAEAGAEAMVRADPSR